MFPFRKKAFDARAFADEKLVESLQTLGLSAQMAGDAIDCGLGGMKVRCADVEISGGGRIASLIVQLVLRPGVVLTENVADMADDARSAIGRACFIWLMSVFTCAAAVYDADGHPGHLASCEDVTLPDSEETPRNWRIISSPQIGFASDDGSAGDDGETAGEPKLPPPTRAAFEPVIEKLARTRDVHALKVLMMNMGDSRHVECSVDGVPTPEIAALFQQFDWQSEAGATLRQFHLMVPLDDEAEAPA